MWNVEFILLWAVVSGSEDIRDKCSVLLWTKHKHSYKKRSKIIYVNAGALEYKGGLAFEMSPAWMQNASVKIMERRASASASAAAWTRCTHESVCWDLALASPRPPTLWLKQIPSSEPPPSLYLYLAVSDRRHETHHIKHQASLRKDQLVAWCFVERVHKMGGRWEEGCSGAW